MIFGVFYFSNPADDPNPVKILSGGRETGVGNLVSFVLYISNNYLNKENGGEQASLPYFLSYSESDEQAELQKRTEVQGKEGLGRIKLKDTGFLTRTADKASPEIGLPKRLIIPSLGIDAKIQYVGLTESGAMEVPGNLADVAWFEPGTRPGQAGNAVIAGHLDGAGGKKAVFWNLYKLKKTNEIYILDDKNNKLGFKVVKIEFYEENASLKSIFGYSSKARLNLITCYGVWDKEKNNYNERLVIFTEAI